MNVQIAKRLFFQLFFSFLIFGFLRIFFLRVKFIWLAFSELVSTTANDKFGWSSSHKWKLQWNRSENIILNHLNKYSDVHKWKSAKCLNKYLFAVGINASQQNWLIECMQVYAFCYNFHRPRVESFVFFFCRLISCQLLILLRSNGQIYLVKIRGKMRLAHIKN